MWGTSAGSTATLLWERQGEVQTAQDGAGVVFSGVTLGGRYRGQGTWWTPLVSVTGGLALAGYRFGLDGELASLAADDTLSLFDVNCPGGVCEPPSHDSAAFVLFGSARLGCALKLTDWLQPAVWLGVNYLPLPEEPVSNTVEPRQVRQPAAALWLFAATFAVRVLL